jgi:hypothetical protein
VPEALEDLADLPLGAHCLGLYADLEEDAEHAAEFVAGAPTWHATAYWVPDRGTSDRCTERIARDGPDHVGCVGILPGGQVEAVEGRLRPVEEIRAFLGAHPEGVSAGADTLSRGLTAGTTPDYLEYEAWFDVQPRDSCRFLCPYDLRMIPPQLAPAVLRDLGAHHSHVALSASESPAVRLLQLFVFARYQDLPAPLLADAEEATAAGLLTVDPATGTFELSERGVFLIEGWSHAVATAVEQRAAAVAGP